VSAGAFVAAKLASVGDVIEHTAVSHQLSAYYERSLRLCGADTLLSKRKRQDYSESRVAVITGSCRAALGLDGRGRPSPHGHYC
jgi:hypothetical protein